MSKSEDKAIAIFEGYKIRRHYDEKKEIWYFSVIDILHVLLQNKDYQISRKYWNKLKERLKKDGSQSVTNCHQLKFPAADVVSALTDSPTPRQYWGKVKDREFNKLELSPIWVRLKLEAEDSKMRLTDCANTESMFRIIQSIPSKKAEPFKRWLAKVGYGIIPRIFYLLFRRFWNFMFASKRYDSLLSERVASTCTATLPVKNAGNLCIIKLLG